MKKIKDYSIASAYIFTFTHLKCLAAFLKFVFTVLKDFFFLQFGNKFHFTRIPVVNVDHPYDNTIPFVPEKVEIYMDFINYWIRPLSMIIKKMGRKAVPEFALWMSYITKCYKEAGLMYRYRMSTMKRPECNGMFLFKVIHAMDPHLLCVPSLHIAIVTLVFSFYKDFFERHRDIFTDEEIHEYYYELYEHGVAIAESVLYVKQHSVNCVPAAMYMMTQLFPDLFSPIDAVEFINRLFEYSTDIEDEDKDNIVRHIEFIYERFLLEGLQGEDWKEPVKRWIVTYENSAK